jgi:hypothetical protein
MFGTKVFIVVLCEISFLFQDSFCNHVPLVEKVVILSHPFLGLRNSFMFIMVFLMGWCTVLRE